MTIFKKINLFVFLFICIWKQLDGQAENFNFDQLTTQAGLSSNTVYSIIEDDLGFVWVGTKRGLNRYDGYDFKSYQLPSLRNKGTTKPTIFSLLMDRKKLIWVGIKDGGLLSYDKTNDTFQRFPFDDNSTVDWSTITVKSLFEDSRQWLWIGTYGGGAIVLNEKREVMFHFCSYCDEAKKEKLSNDFVFDFAEDSGGNVYIATAGKGLNIFQAPTKTIEVIHTNYAEDMNSFGKTLCLDNAETLWIGTEGNGLYTYDTKNKTWQNYQANHSDKSINSNIVKDIHLDKKGQVWIATDGGGLNQYNPQTKQFQYFQYTATSSAINTLNTNALYDLHFDKSDNLWIGTYNGGINILKAIPSPFYTKRKYDAEKRQGLRSVLTVREDDNRRVWLGTDGGGMFYFDANVENLTLKNASELLRQGTFNDVVTCIQPNGREGLWYGSFANGLNYFDFKKGVIQQYIHQENDAGSLIHNNVWDIEMDKNGGLWIGTLGGGIDYLPKGATAFQHFDVDLKQLSDVQIIDLLLDRKNKYLWIATESKGLNRLEIATKKVQQYQHSPDSQNSIRSNDLQALFEDKSGNIWVVSDIGVDKLNPLSEEISPLAFEHKFSIGNINSLQEDEKGFIWLSTSTGIHRLHPADNTIIEIGVEPALGNNMSNPKAAHRLSDGRIVFGGINYFSIIVPQQLQLNNNTGIPVFTDLELLNKPVKIGQHGGRVILNKDLNEQDAEVRLSYQDRGIVFKWSTTEFSDSPGNKYAYKLAGFDEKWNYVAADQRSIYYASLGGGSYQLKIRAANSSGVWSETTREIDVFVNPPFWETTWFIVLAAGSIIIIVLLIYYFLLNRQKGIYEHQALEQEQEILKKEQEILQLKNENLEEEITRKKAELNASILQVAHKNEFLSVLKGRIRKIKEDSAESAAKPLRSVVNIINKELSQDDYWEQFQLIFDQTFQDFIKQLEAAYPILTANDHRLCCFIKMKLNNREIASILNITLNAVEQAKYRLKKKIELAKSESLNEFIQQFGKGQSQ